MNTIQKTIATIITIYVGCRVLSKMSYNILIESRMPRWLVFSQHPIKYMMNHGALEK